MNLSKLILSFVSKLLFCSIIYSDDYFIRKRHTNNSMAMNRNRNKKQKQFCCASNFDNSTQQATLNEWNHSALTVLQHFGWARACVLSSLLSYCLSFAVPLSFSLSCSPNTPESMSGNAFTALIWLCLCLRVRHSAWVWVCAHISPYTLKPIVGSSFVVHTASSCFVYVWAVNMFVIVKLFVENILWCVQYFSSHTYTFVASIRVHYISIQFFLFSFLRLPSLYILIRTIR